MTGFTIISAGQCQWQAKLHGAEPLRKRYSLSVKKDLAIELERSICQSEVVPNAVRPVLVSALLSAMRGDIQAGYIYRYVKGSTSVL